MSKEIRVKSKNELSDKIFNFFRKNPNKVLSIKNVNESLNTKYTKEEILKSIYKLLVRNKITEVEKGKYIIELKKAKILEGRIQFNQQKNAYLVVEGEEKDIFIPKNSTLNALDGDIVKIEANSNNGSKSSGKVLEVISRKRTKFVGIVQITNPNYGFVIIDNTSIHVDFYVPTNLLIGAENGQKVIVELIKWDENRDSPDGKIIEILGSPGSHEVEINSILVEYNLPYKFTEEVENDAKNISTEISKEEVKKRRDIRKILTLTIDPKDAKDFDDAISIETLKNGNTEIGVHIADVSHYVKPGTLLDEEAFKRATSVYLVDRVVPMLPEILSNNVCSLRPNEDKLTFSIFFEFNNQQEIVKQWIGKTIINSNHRFTYEEAQKIIETKEGLYSTEVLTFHSIASKLREDRIKNGSISFDKLEVKFILDNQNKPKEIFFKIGKEANHLIEEFMLLANKKVTEFVSLNKEKETTNTFIYRIHDKPNYNKIIELKAFIKKFGYDFNLVNKEEIRKSFNKLLNDIKNKPEENMIETLSMRCMSKAVYSTENIGHYGLAFLNYSHFTSPIRRYPDIMVHRLIEHYLNGGISQNKETYEENCSHCSTRERLASNAERDSIKYMQTLYLNGFIGKELEGLISGVTEWGIYVETKDSLAEGLIRIRNLEGDFTPMIKRTTV
ncbi:MAG: ribonuclease R [Solirubrobacteraceae bacterium]